MAKKQKEELPFVPVDVTVDEYFQKLAVEGVEGAKLLDTVAVKAAHKRMRAK